MNIITQGTHKSKKKYGVQLRLFHHSCCAGLSCLFEGWRLWGGSVLFDGLIQTKGKSIESLVLAYLARGPLGTHTQTGIAESLEHDELFDYYTGIQVKQWDISRFLNRLGQSSFDLWNRVIGKMQQSAKTRCISSGVLILDDTILEKTGTRMAGVRVLFDHAKKTFVKGLSLVQLFYVDSQKHYPLWYALHSNRGRKPKPTKDRTAPIGKYKIALRLIRQSLECGIRPKAVLFDAWYASTGFLKALRKMNLRFVSRLNSSRYILLNGRKIKAADLLKQKHRYRYYHSLNANAFLIEATLPNYGPITAVFVRYRNKNAIIITDLPASDPVSIVSLYRQRWMIEVYFREAKQVFGLDKFQNRSASSIQAHLALTALAYVLITLLRILLPPIQKLKPKALFKKLFRVLADLTIRNNHLEITVGKHNLFFSHMLLLLNNLKPLESTA